MIQDFNQSALDYHRVEEAITFLERNFHSQPSLTDIAKSIHLSEFHFQRLFTRWVGISPKRFLQFLTKEHAKELLRQSHNLLNVTYETGLSSPGRLHDLFVNCEAVTPGEYKKLGEGLNINYGFHPSPFGEILLATTERGICWLSFVKQGGPDVELTSLKAYWPRASFREGPNVTSKLVARIFAFHSNGKSEQMKLFLKGTNFQIKVWEALLKIPSGHVVSYEDIASSIGKPKAVRAVANAVARNHIPFIIPCHRVIRKIGEFGGYQAGTARKKALLGWEATKSGMAV